MDLRRLIAIACILALCLSPFSFAYGQISEGISQKAAIKKVKELFDTTDFDVFDIDYSEYRGQKFWQLSWSQSEEPHASLTATVDARDGNIQELYVYKGYDPQKKTPLVPQLKEEEARKKAEEFILKLQAEEFADTILVERPLPEYRPLGELRIVQQYDFYYLRHYEGVPVEGDGFNISVDANTGEILRYSFKWTRTPLPSKDKIISQEDAKDTFLAEENVTLIYNRYFNYRTREEAIKLVYRVEKPGILIDAFSGEIIDEYGIYGADLASKEMATSEARGDGFTPVEQAEIEASKECITKEAAVKAVEKYFNIPEGYRLSNARLYEVYGSPEQRIWSLDWNKESKDGHYGSIYAQVDARNSELLNYRKYDNAMFSKDAKQKYDVNRAQTKAEEFLKAIQPQRFTSVKLEELPKTPGAPEEVRQHNFHYVRYVNDIPYPANGFNLSIDAASGEITYYNMQWQDSHFPSPEGIMAQKRAEERFFEDVGLKLAYVGIYDPNTGETLYKLVYKINPAQSYVFDAFSFDPLDQSGKPIEQEEPTVFTDIEGHWAQKDIELLVELGIIDSKESEFKPDDSIAVGDFIKLLMVARGQRLPIIPPPRPLDSTLDEEIDNYFNAAKRLGWIKEGEFSPDDHLPRQKVAALLIRAQGYEAVASLPEIFRVPADDAHLVRAEYKGHVSIALGQGLLGKIRGNFNPDTPITNAEAATVLVRLLMLNNH